MSEKEFLYNQQPPPYNTAIAGGPSYPGAVPEPYNPKFNPQNAPSPGFANQVYPSIPPTTVIAQPVQRIIVSGVRFGPFPIKAPCGNCQQEVVTTTTPITGGITWLLSGILCLSGLFCGCCLLPFCIDACQDIEHHCPNCRSTLGIYKRMG